MRQAVSRGQVQEHAGFSDPRHTVAVPAGEVTLQAGVAEELLQIPVGAVAHEEQGIPLGEPRQAVGHAVVEHAGHEFDAGALPGLEVLERGRGGGGQLGEKVATHSGKGRPETERMPSTVTRCGRPSSSRARFQP